VSGGTAKGRVKDDELDSILKTSREVEEDKLVLKWEEVGNSSYTPVLDDPCIALEHDI
jgi:hypothetical protein